VHGEVSDEVFWSVRNSWQKKPRYEQDCTFGMETYQSKKRKNEQILAPYPCVSSADRIKNACDRVKDVKHFTGPSL
jgi:hypothetical protein